MASRSPTGASAGTPPSRCSTALRTRSGRAAERRPSTAGMRIAVIGIGLIGGSVGLAARERLGATVSGYDQSEDALRGALARGALDRACASVAEAVGDAEAAFVAVPVGQVPGLVGATLDAAPADCVVTDVGSTKRAVVAAHRDPRFVGGHPLAGAESSGVEHARADLFRRATWYLTPSPSTSGVHYERLYRLLHDLGARPTAIDAETHDRILASVSHLPHVLANVLVSLAARTLAEGGERLPAIGPSFRDATRVAGAPSTTWTDAAGADRRRLLESQLAGGPLFEVRASVPNRPGVIAQLALELGRGGVNITDMALYPAADMSEGVVALWVSGMDAARRTEALVAGLGFPVARA